MQNAPMWISALATVAIFYVTWKYTTYTKSLLERNDRLISLARQQERNSRAPVVMLKFFESSPTKEAHIQNIPSHGEDDRIRQLPAGSVVNLFEDFLLNIGSGPALELSVRTNGWALRDGRGDIMEAWPYEIGNVLPAFTGERATQICFNVMPKLMGPSAILIDNVKFEVTYESISGVKFRTRFHRNRHEFEVLVQGNWVRNLTSEFVV